ncbi:MAG: CPBP family intramembrane metalloprotease [Kineosporiaceae bacterium]|nr:CPBP family intramembrane metalloprotease [Kineosporiaceae bacterium]MBK7625414.1 CPBP family intramembrane metalloprotease [Kineosporiaceae bacterium]MBK8076223.1 CPBP family intramembrane metalloprotease [Kineosporiaceae bacterium]
MSLRAPDPIGPPSAVGSPAPWVALPAGPPQAWLARPYSQLLRGPNHRWWRPLVSLAIAAGATFAVLVLSWVVTAALLMGQSAGSDGSGAAPSDAEYDRWAISPTGVLVTNLVLAALIVVAQAAVWGGHGWRPRWLASVTGGVRWAWLVTSYLVSLLVLVIADALLLALDGDLTWQPESQAGLYAVIVITTTPLQAAGEEYLFRGWLTQAIGAWIPRAEVGAIVAALVSGTLFALAHGQQDPWLFADRFVFGLAASWLVWRTGGLEASIAMHGANNVIAFAYSVGSGHLEEMLDATTSTPESFVADLVLMVLTAVVLDRLARRRAVPRLFHPPMRAW